MTQQKIVEQIVRDSLSKIRIRGAQRSEIVLMDFMLEVTKIVWFDLSPNRQNCIMFAPNVALSTELGSIYYIFEKLQKRSRTTLPLADLNLLDFEDFQKLFKTVEDFIQSKVLLKYKPGELNFELIWKFLVPRYVTQLVGETTQIDFKERFRSILEENFSKVSEDRKEFFIDLIWGSTDSTFSKLYEIISNRESKPETLLWILSLYVENFRYIAEIADFEKIKIILEKTSPFISQEQLESLILLLPEVNGHRLKSILRIDANVPFDPIFSKQLEFSASLREEVSTIVYVLALRDGLQELSTENLLTIFGVDILG